MCFGNQHTMALADTDYSLTTQLTLFIITLSTGLHFIQLLAVFYVFPLTSTSCKLKFKTSSDLSPLYLPVCRTEGTQWMFFHLIKKLLNVLYLIQCFFGILLTWKYLFFPLKFTVSRKKNANSLNNLFISGWF